MDDKTLDLFKDGVRVLLLIQRSKEGGTGNLRKQKKLISKGKEEFDILFAELRKLRTEYEKSGETYRIYSSVNPRDVNKAIRLFKFNQLEADFYDEDSKNQFYFDVKNRWVSCLMNPKSKAESRFLIDIDDESEEMIDVIRRDIIKNGQAKIFAEYPTKNGWHIVTEPFNPNNVLMEKEGVASIKKDSLILIDY